MLKIAAGRRRRVSATAARAMAEEFAFSFSASGNRFTTFFYLNVEVGKIYVHL